MIPEYFAYLCIIFGFIGIFSYIKDILKGNTKPNIVSWIFWSVAPLLGAYFGYKSGISFPLLISTFVAGFFPLIVVIFSITNKNSYWKISKFDIVCGVISFLSIIIWIITKSAIWSIVFAMLADLFASIPTIIKNWKHENTEISITYFLGIVNQIITFMIMSKFELLTTIFPIYLILINIVIILVIKKNYLFKIEE